MQKLNVYDAIILTMYAKGEHPIGRTALQKVIYFANLKTDSDISYVHHFYGPFSRDVAVALEDLVAINSITETVTSTYTHETYSYDLAAKWKRVAEKWKDNNPRHYSIIEDIVNKCNSICQLQAKKLSYAAKALYILRRSSQAGTKGITSHDVKIIGKGFGWTISENDAERGFELLFQLGLVKK